MQRAAAALLRWHATAANSYSRMQSNVSTSHQKVDSIDFHFLDERTYTPYFICEYLML